MTDLTTECAECGAPDGTPCHPGCICGCQPPESSSFPIADHMAAFGYYRPSPGQMEEK